MSTHAPQASIPSMGVLRAQAPRIKAILSDAGATNVRVFGSLARGSATPSSDIDLLVDVSPTTSVFDLAHAQRLLVALLGCAVDIVPASGLKPRHRRVLAEARPL